MEIKEILTNLQQEQIWDDDYLKELINKSKRVNEKLDVVLDMIQFKNIFNNKGISWNIGNPINLNDFKKAIQQKIPEQNKSYNIIKGNKNNNWHLGRLIYFVNHPKEINDIVLKYYNNGMYELIDGFHRLMAAVYLKLDYIDIICVNDK